MAEDIVIIGIGQSLRGDDRAGLEAIKRWQLAYPETANHFRVRIEACELPGLNLLNLLQDASAAVIVDAVLSENPPGSLHCINFTQLDSFPPGYNSAHGWGVAETLLLGKNLLPENMPGSITILGIEAETLAFGENLSESVSQVMDQAVQLIETIIRKYL